MRKIKSPLLEKTLLKEAADDLTKSKGPILLTGCIDASKAYLSYELGEKFSSKLIVTYSDVRAGEIMDDLSMLGESPLLYPSKDLLFYKADSSGKYLIKQRMDILRRLFADEEITVVMIGDALLEKTRSPRFIQDKIIKLRKGDEISLTELELDLAKMGYERSAQVMSSGEFALRGGIIDIYPIASEDPIRVELFGDEIDTIRSFDTESQRTIENLSEATVFPAEEISELSDYEDTASFLDYFPNDGLIILDEPQKIYEKLKNVHDEFERAESLHSDEGEISLFETNEVMQTLSGERTIALAGFEQTSQIIKYKNSYYLQAQNASAYLGNFPELIKDLKTWEKEKARVILLAGSTTRAKRLAEELNDNDVRAYYVEDSANENLSGAATLVMPGNLKRGFGYPSIKFYILSSGDVFGREKRKKRARKIEGGIKITELSSLSVDDYVIHENYGLGIYKGTERIERKGITRDYMKILYGDGGMLFLPVTQMDVVQKYADAEAVKIPKLNKLSGDDWKKTKARVRGVIKDIAEKLVKLYATRASSKGFAFSKDTVWQKEFEEQFQFEETEDQLRAIEETKADMESDKIMDRLICGDVGFGKTEIAIRAAFKAVQDNKQVAYLCPTTILASQHYNTFAQRLSEYGPNIELLCRFKTAAEQKKIIEKIGRGEVDIVIGTHRLLSKDVKFSDLGLLVIDEEQRFGVSDKEKIKELKTSVDVISLSATPIPRTLHMSLIGIRDMSVLRQPPLDRMPIQTYVMEYEDEIVSQAIRRELARGGQTYYVYNNIRGIAQVAQRISKLVPDANVAYAHGRMSQDKLESIMLDFINGDIDVLVSTTIIETGLDISNVNTIIIQGAERFGLSQLYQLRGRVGRSNRTAYAFLLYNGANELKEKAEKRLTAIREHTELGSGIKIAARDLELRGAGNLLGAEQSGEMEAVGYDMYCKMLSDEVRLARGEVKSVGDFETEFDASIDAFIPDDYIIDEALRIGIYRRIAGIESEEELLDVTDELIDRFGDVPKPVINLARSALVKKKAHDAYITEIKAKPPVHRIGEKDEPAYVEISMYDGAPVDTEKLESMLKKYKNEMRIRLGTDVLITYTDKPHKYKDLEAFWKLLDLIIAQIDGLML